MMRTTHTYVLMDVPKEFFELVQKKMQDAGYDRALIDEDGQLRIDMDGIALVVEEATSKLSGLSMSCSNSGHRSAGQDCNSECDGLARSA